MKRKTKKAKTTKRRVIKKKTRAKKGVARKKTIFTATQRKSLEGRLTKLAKDIVSIRKDYNSLIAALSKM